jgi:DeoR/GlpR family transcriptional regulator of sugar metabolism
VDNSSPVYRKGIERRESIIDALRAEGFLSVADLARRLEVSPMTVRRDLQQLEQTGQVRMVYGGASLSVPRMRGSGLWVGMTAADEARIGRCAARLVGEADNIAIDAGRIGYEIARALPERFHGTVVTNSIPVIELLVTRAQPPRVVGLGGEVSPDTYAFVGAGAVAAIEGVRVGTLFLTADALDDRGAYAHSDAEASVKRALWNIAGRTVLVARHDAFSDTAPLLLGPLNQLAALVSDRWPPTKVDRALRTAGVDVLVAEDAGSPAPSGNRANHHRVT